MVRMNQTTKHGFVCAALAALSLAGCGSPEEPATPTTAPVLSSSGPTTTTEQPWPTLEPGANLPEAADAAVDRTDPEQVALETIRIIHTRDTTVEPQSGDSFARAADLMTGKLRDELIVDSSSARPSMQWSEWMKREATIAAETAIMVEEHPADEPDRWQRAVEVDEYVTAANGSKIGQFRVVHYLDVRNEDGEWRVDGISFGERLPAR